MRWQPTRRRRLASLVMSPARATVGVGALAAAIAGLMPWAEGTVPGHAGFEPAFFSGLGGAGDGVLLLLLVGGTAFLVLHHTPATSRVRLVHVVPYLLVLLAAITVANGHRAAVEEIAAWGRRGGSGRIAPGMWLAVAGVVVMAAGLLALAPGVVRWRRSSEDPSDLMRVSGRAVAELVVAAAGLLAGGAAGIEVALSMTPVPLIGLIFLGAVFGGLFGAYAGAWVGRSVADEVSRRRRPAA